MSRPITWRGVQAESQRDALLGRAEALRSIQQGISGVGSLFDEQKRNIEQDELNSVLNRIQGIDSVEGVDSAIKNQLIGNSGLDSDQQIKARSALNQQSSDLMQRLNLRDTFDKNQLSKQEEPIINNINKLKAENKFDEALSLAQNLSNAGGVIAELNAAKKGFNKKSSLDDLKETTYFNLKGIGRSVAGNREISSNMLKEHPYLSEGLDLSTDGTLKFKEGLSKELREQYAPAMEEANQMYSSASSYEDLVSNLLQRALSDPNVNINDIGGLIQEVQTARSFDPVAAEQDKTKETLKLFNQLAQDTALTKVQRSRDEIEKSYPKNPVFETALDSTINLSDTLDKFSEYASDNEEYFGVGSGDEAGFRGNVLGAVSKFESLLRSEAKKFPENSEGRRFLENYTVNGGLLNLALNNIEEVVEAKKEGNLNDRVLPEFLGDLGRSMGVSDEVREEDILVSLKSFLPTLSNSLKSMEGRKQELSDLDAKEFNIKLEALKKR